MSANVKTSPPPTIGSSLEKPLLKLYSAVGTAAFWRAVQSVINAALPDSFVGITLQHSPIQPMIAKWTRRIPDGLVDLGPLKKYLDCHPRARFVRSSDVFPDPTTLLSSDFYRQYMAPQRRAHAIGLFFWSANRLICVIVIMRTARQGEFTSLQMKLLRSLYPQFQTALRRLRSLEREHSARVALEEFIRRLPLPTILLRWNLKLVYRNQAAREFCAVWQRGPRRAELLKADKPVPNDILDACRELKKRWQRDRQSPPLAGSGTASCRKKVRHPKLRHLSANLQLRQISSLGVARPHFLIECAEFPQPSRSRGKRRAPRLPHLARLTRRERQVTRIVCDGRSNQEIADEAKLSVAMVKKHIHAIFRKLEVPNRSRLVALLL